jgi:hypothetical protein
MIPVNKVSASFTHFSGPDDHPFKLYEIPEIIFCEFFAVPTVGF